MKHWLAHLDRLIAAMEAPTLNGAGSVSHQQAMEKAGASTRSTVRWPTRLLQMSSAHISTQ